MNKKRFFSVLMWLIFFAFTTLACNLTEIGGDNIPNNATVVTVWANSSLQPWLTEAAEAFNDSKTETAVGNPVYILTTYIEAGQAISDLNAGAFPPDMWIPDDMVWVNTLADQGNMQFQGDCVSTAESPLVIGMWREAAESLGWPGLPLGWLDIGSLAADPNAWAYYSGGLFGDTLRLSHTHPGLSGTGASTLLALVHAAESKTEPVTAVDIQKPIVQASVGAFESAVAFFGNSTLNLGKTMAERGSTYLGAAVMYESTVVTYGGGQIVPIYPLEGTFVATHPACINQSTDTEMTEGAKLFRNYLLSEVGQQLAVTNGLRPVNAAVAPAPPLDEQHGVDLTQPEIIFTPPSVDALYAIQELWQSARKDVNLVMLLDTSGSMRGDKVDSMKEAAVQFVEQMGDDDTITVITFSTAPSILIPPTKVGEARNKIINAIQQINAGGDTALFDAISQGAAVLGGALRADATNVMVVLTDGVDTSSIRPFNDQLIQDATQNNTTVFTIAYGSDADEDVLQNLAFRANGNYYQGDAASIAAIYDEMSAAFGGSVGVGR
ncbi:MAG: VWA domain-containing protein [Candidatus Promineifilaceae bacterium]